MGRPSKLTEKQWADIEKKLLNGETPASLAKQYGINRAALSRKFSQRIATVKHVANQIVETEQNFKSLPLTQQLQAINLADQLRSISMHLGSAANYGAMTAHKLSGLANAKAQLLDESVDVDSDEGLAKLRGIAALTKLSNDSAQIGIDLLKANKDAIDAINQPEKKTIKTITIIKAEDMV